MQPRRRFLVLGIIWGGVLLLILGLLLWINPPLRPPRLIPTADYDVQHWPGGPPYRLTCLILSNGLPEVGRRVQIEFISDIWKGITDDCGRVTVRMGHILPFLRVDGEIVATNSDDLFRGDCRLNRQGLVVVLSKWTSESNSRALDLSTNVTLKP